MTRPFDWEATALVLATAVVVLVAVLRRQSRIGTRRSPIADPPVADPPVADPTTTDPPAADPPTTDPPAADPPTTDPSVADPPTANPPVVDPPTTDPPVADPPATDPRLRRSALLWSALVLAALAWELFAWSRQPAWDVPDPSHPTLSTLLSPLIDHGPGRFAAWFLWLAAGWRLSR